MSREDSRPLHILWLARHATADHPVPALAELMRAEGHRVDVIGWAEPNAPNTPDAPKAPNATGRIDRPLMKSFAVGSAGDRREPVRVHLPSLRLLRLLRSSPADVIIHRDLGPLAAAVWLCRLGGRGTPSLMLLEHQLDRAGPAATIWWKRALRRLLAKSPTVALANHGLAADQLAEFGIPPERIRTGWWLAGFDAASDKAPTDNKPGRSGSSIVKLIAVGRLSKRKGVDFVIDAVADAVDTVELTIVGVGPEEADLRARVDRASLGDRVTFLGSCDHDQLRILLPQHDALVMGSFEDHTGRAAIEAMSLGVPVIASSRSGIADILVDHDVNGLIVDPTDSARFGQLLASLTPERLDRIRRGAANTAPMLQPKAAADVVLAAATQACSFGRRPVRSNR